MNLYQVPGEYHAWLEGLDAAGGELTPELEAGFRAIDESFFERAAAVVALIRNSQADAEALKAEGNDFLRKARAAENRVKSLRKVLVAAMKAMGYDRADTGRWKVSLRRNPIPKITWAGGTIPERFRRVVTELDLKAVQDAWKAGEELPEGFAADHTEYIVID